jgi:hypothetical protein
LSKLVHQDETEVILPVLPDDIFKIPQLEARNPPKIMVFCRKTPKISNK